MTDTIKSHALTPFGWLSKNEQSELRYHDHHGGEVLGISDNGKFYVKSAISRFEAGRVYIATTPPMQFLIWWSPVGRENGSDTVEAASFGEALGKATAKMGGCGAYGAEPLVTARINPRYKEYGR